LKTSHHPKTASTPLVTLGQDR